MSGATKTTQPMLRRSVRRSADRQLCFVTIKTEAQQAAAGIHKPISKRGNGYLRWLLVNGAMSVLSSKQAKQDPGRSNCSKLRSAWSPPARSPTGR
jgi:transposase